MQNLMQISNMLKNLLMLKGAQACGTLFVVEILGPSKVTWGLKQKNQFLESLRLLFANLFFKS
jgi:hypothetical protein